MFGIDYAWGRPSVKAMKKAGVKFVCRYVSTNGNSKNIDEDEVAYLRKAGIDIVIVFETFEGRALAGFGAGRFDAISAEQQVAKAGGPKDSVIYFAVDFDAAGSELAKIGDYFRGVSSVLGRQRTGAYGGVAVMDYLFANGVIAYGWETYAWQYRNRSRPWHPKAQLQQYSNGRSLDGVSVDYNRAMAEDFGQWGYKAPAPKPAKKKRLPGPSPKPGWFFAAVKQFLANRRKKA